MNRNRLHRRTWDAALCAVQEHLAAWPAVAPLTDDHQEIVTIVSKLCERLKARHRLLAVHTDKALARKYAISSRTVRNWRKAGCPFGQGQQRVLDWLATRRYAPTGAEAKFKLQLQNRRWKLRHPLKDLAAIRLQILALRDAHRGAGLPVPDWVQRMGYRRR